MISLANLGYLFIIWLVMTLEAGIWEGIQRFVFWVFLETWQVHSQKIKLHLNMGICPPV